MGEAGQRIAGRTNVSGKCEVRAWLSGRQVFGDVVSAIDFEMAMERLADPKGDRVEITMSGKSLPSSRAAGNAQQRGCKRK